MSPETLAATVRQAIRDEQQRIADFIVTFEYRNYEQSDQGFIQFRQDLSDAVLGKPRTPIVCVVPENREDVA